VVQQPGSSYAYTASGTTLTLSAATSATDTMYAVFLGKAVQTVNPPSGSVNTAQLVDGSVNNAKIASDASIATTKLGTGAVLQVVQSTHATAVNSTSTSYVTTGLSASITPSSTSNKVLIMASSTMLSTTSSDVLTTIFRGTVSGTNLASSGSMSTKYNNQSSEPSAVTNIFLDSPSTTSSQEYTFAFRSSVSGQQSRAQAGGIQGSIILMEIAG
jgi:hypothetical protein